MTSVPRLLLLAASLVAAANCATPPDAPPAPTAAQAAKMLEVEEELLAAAMSHPEGQAARLADRLEGLTVFQPAPDATQAFAAALVMVVSSGGIGQDGLAHLAYRAYELMNGGYFPRARLNALLDEIDRWLEREGVVDASRVSFRLAAERVAREQANPRTDWW